MQWDEDLPFHSFSEIGDAGDRLKALGSVRRHFAPDGRFLVTLHNPAVQIPRLDGGRRVISERPMRGGRTTLRVWSTARYNRDRRPGETRQDRESLEAAGETVERRELSPRFAIVDRPTFEAKANPAGFEIQHLSGDY